MRFEDFFRCLEKARPSPRVEVDLLAQIVNDGHQGVGRVTFKYFENFEGAQPGNFIWLDEDRTTPYDESFNDAVVFVNDKYRDDKPMRRMVCAKELMHVFDAKGEQADTPDKVRALLEEIEASPLPSDASPIYTADRGALWKAAIALVPPWIRDEYVESWARGEIAAHELATRLSVPESVAAAVMGGYYDIARQRLGL